MLYVFQGSLLLWLNGRESVPTASLQIPTMLTLLSCMHCRLKHRHCTKTQMVTFSPTSWYFADENTNHVTLSLVITVKTASSNVISLLLLLPLLKGLLDFCKGDLYHPKQISEMVNWCIWLPYWHTHVVDCWSQVVNVPLRDFPSSCCSLYMLCCSIASVCFQRSSTAVWQTSWNRV